MAMILSPPTFFASSIPFSRPFLVKMAINCRSSTSSFSSLPEKRKKVPILLFDVMDTLVRDPFYEDVPAFFGMPLKELLEIKHPIAWIEFEKGLLNETELAKKFFKDGRQVDLEGLKECMRRGYSYVDGIEVLLHNLKQNNYEMHAFTNYPIWYTIIEEKLKISKYVSWTFCSCIIGKRKPEADIYLEVLHHLGVDPENCIFIDDRCTSEEALTGHDTEAWVALKVFKGWPVNVEAAVNAGMIGLHFKNAASLQQDLALLGIKTGSLLAN